MSTGLYLLRSLLISVFFLACMVGCATFKGRSQYVKVVSNPPGAEILLDGQKSLGRTPAFVEVPRSRRRSLVLKSPLGVETSLAETDLGTPGGSVEATRKNQRGVRVSLISEYRWQESFIANFVWITPLISGPAIGIDFWSGAAWEYKPLKMILLPGRDLSQPLRLPVHSVAVAPPRSDYYVLSEEMGLEIQKALKARLARADIRSYDSTSDTFSEFGSTYSGSGDRRHDDELYRDLNVSHVAWSQITREAKVTRARIHLRDVFLDRDVGTMNVEIPNSDLSSLSATRTNEVLFRSLTLIPNTIGFPVVNNVKSNIEAVDVEGQSYRARSQSKETWVDFISRVSLRNVPHAKAMRFFKGRFRLVPDIAYSNIRFQLERKEDPTKPPANAPPSAIGTDFRYQTFHLGFGPELGLETPAGYLYLQVIPSYAATWIGFQSANGRYQNQSNEFAISYEMGFAFFVTDEINVRLFTSARNTRKESWTEAFQQAGLNDFKASQAGYVVSGISLNYYVPAVRRILRGFVLE